MSIFRSQPIIPAKPEQTGSPKGKEYFSQGVKARAKDFFDPKSWAQFLKIAGVGDAANFGLRIGLRLAGIKSLRMLLFSGRAADEIASGYLTKKFRQEDGAKAWSYEIVDGFCVWTVLLGGMQALRKVGFALNGMRGFGVQGLLMGAGILVGEQVTKALGSKRRPTDLTLADMSLALLDAYGVMAKGRAMRAARLDVGDRLSHVEARVVQHQRVFAADGQDQPPEKGKAFTSEDAERQRLISAAAKTIERQMKAGEFQQSFNALADLLWQPALRHQDRSRITKAMTLDYPADRLPLDNPKHARDLIYAMRRIRLKILTPSSGAEESKYIDRQEQLYKRLCDRDFENIEALTHLLAAPGHRGFLDTKDHMVFNYAKRYLLEPDYIRSLAGDVSETYHLVDALTYPYGQKLIPLHFTLAHLAAQNYLAHHPTDAQSLSAEQKMMLAFLYTHVGQKQKGDEIVSQLDLNELLQDRNSRYAAVLYWRYHYHQPRLQQALLHYPDPPKPAPQPSDIARLFVSQIRPDNVHDYLSQLSDAELGPAMVRHFAEVLPTWLDRRHQSQCFIVLQALQADIRSHEREIAPRYLHAFYQVAFKMGKKDMAQDFANALAAQTTRLANRHFDGQPEQAFYFADVVVEHRQFAPLQEVINHAMTRFGAWTLPEAIADYRDHLSVPYLKQLDTGGLFDIAVSFVNALEKKRPLTMEERYYRIKALAELEQVAEVARLTQEAVDDFAESRVQSISPSDAHYVGLARDEASRLGLPLRDQSMNFSTDVSQMGIQEKLSYVVLKINQKKFDDALEVLKPLHCLETWQDPHNYQYLSLIYHLWQSIEVFKKNPDASNPLVTKIKTPDGQSVVLSDVFSRLLELAGEAQEQQTQPAPDYFDLSKALKQSLPVLLEGQKYEALKEVGRFMVGSRAMLKSQFGYDDLPLEDYRVRYFYQQAFLEANDPRAAAHLQYTSLKMKLDDTKAKTNADAYYAALMILDHDTRAGRLDDRAFRKRTLTGIDRFKAGHQSEPDKPAGDEIERLLKEKPEDLTTPHLYHLVRYYLDNGNPKKANSLLTRFFIHDEDNILPSSTVRSAVQLAYQVKKALLAASVS